MLRLSTHVWHLAFHSKALWSGDEPKACLQIGFRHPKTQASGEHVNSPKTQPCSQGFGSVRLGGAPLPVISASTPDDSDTQLGCVWCHLVSCLDSADLKGLVKGVLKLAVEKAKQPFCSKGNVPCFRKTAGGCLKCPLTCQEDKFFLDYWGCLASARPRNRWAAQEG